MISFLRNFRKVTVIKNNYIKYLLYGLGEILLVVIGILIALKIGNHNEFKKDIAFEYETLSQIYKNLNTDKTTLLRIHNNANRAVSSSQKLLEYNSEKHALDSLKYWMGDIVQFDRFHPLTNAFEVLKSKGLEKIQHKELRYLLGHYYDDEAKKTIAVIKDIENAFLDYWMPVMRDNAKDFKFGSYAILKDFDKIQKPTIIRNNIIMNKDNYRGEVYGVGNCLRSIDQLVEILEGDYNFK